MTQARPSRLMQMLLAVCLPALMASAASSERDAQRKAFREAYPQAELGIWEMSGKREALLRRYVLWPDLRAAWLKSRLRSDHAAIEEFVDTYRDLKPARELRYHYALSLASQERWDAFLKLYKAHYQELGIARLDCLALRAEIDALSASQRRERAAALWLTPRSQAKECDPAFARLRREGILDDALYKKRFDLALEARELGIARYLARSLPDDFQLEARRWTRAYGLPREFLDEHNPALQSPAYREQLVSAVARIAYDDPALARQYWSSIRAQYAFTALELADTDRHIALWLARNHHGDAFQALNGLAGLAVDEEVRRWRVRTALREHRWADVIRHIDELPAAAQDTLQWQYWRAIALQEASDPAAKAILATLAADRSYYGFLAADALGIDYAFGHRDLIPREATLKAIARLPAIERALELYFVGLDGRGRSEWDAAVATMTEQEQVQAAILAHRNGWHSRAIATAAINERFDDLGIRYPLPFAAEFDSYAKAAGVRPSWAFGIARSESLFMPDIRSSAGAIGVMQLMPATGRFSATQMGLPYNGRATLTDPVSNIRLGTWFLGNMQQRFANHPVLATAAYNAGPLRVEAWLPQADSLDARIWIETIPYAETRGYVRRVLTADAIFHWRMAGEISRLSTHLAPVLPLARVAAHSANQDAASAAND